MTGCMRGGGGGGGGGGSEWLSSPAALLLLLISWNSYVTSQSLGHLVSFDEPTPTTDAKDG